MKKFKVTIIETLVYEIEVEAETQEMAEDRAYEHPNFCSNICDKNDSYVKDVEEIEELTVEIDY